MFFINRTPRIIIVALMLALILGGSLSVSAQSGGELVVGMNAPVNLDPATGDNDPEVLFNRSIYDYLIDVAADGSLVPNLAESWEVSDDGLVYTFALRQGVTFHDGSPFTAADVVFSFERLKELESLAISEGLGDFSVEADGDHNVVFTITAPSADFLFGIAHQFAFILKAGTENPNVLGSGDDLYANFNGTGPFILADYRPGERAEFSANPDYWWEGQPLLDRLVFIYFDDMQAQIDALRSGAVHFIFKLPFDQALELEGEAGLNVIFKPTNQHPVIRLRSDADRLGENPLVRLAFKYATDRELLNLRLFGGQAAVGNNDPIGPLYGPFFNSELVNQEYDPDEACRLLNEAGYPDGLGADEPLRLYVVDAFNYRQMAEELQQQWAAACIQVEILMRPENIYYGDNEWFEVNLGITGWGSRPTPQAYLNGAYRTGGGGNESHWSDPELDALIDLAAVTADIDERAALYVQISEIFRDRGPIIVPFFVPTTGATRDSIVGLDMHPFPGRTDFRLVSVSE